MKLDLINPFIHTVLNTMETMLAIKPTKHKPYTKSNNLTEGDVTGLVGFASDKLSGTVALSFPKDTASKIIKL